MAILDDLIMKVEDPVLRDRLKKEVHKATKHKKFGLVFEEHLPECTPLYDVPVKKGSRVAPRDTEIKETYTVKSIDGEVAICVSNTDKTEYSFNMNDIFVVAEFGEPIYPYLQPIDTVCNAPESDLWHTLIEADNYHALQLLEYMYAGKVDCIYIDPPYNKEDSKDWKYNCNYVDGNDMYRHSKWLSMMERRLKLAKKLLNPKDSVLIVTIDELEYLHLGMLLEQMFPEAFIQMIASVNMPAGSSRSGRFSRNNEFIYFLFFGDAKIENLETDMIHENLSNSKKKNVRWSGLIRNGEGSNRSRIPSLFYPILFKCDTGEFYDAGDPLPLEMNRSDYIPPEGTFAVFPVDGSGQELMWRLYPPTLKSYIKQGYVRFGKYTPTIANRTISYLQSGTISKIEKGDIKIIGHTDEGAVILEYEEGKKTFAPMTIWNKTSHSASEYGAGLLKKIIPGRKFPYPKSLYAVHDCLAFATKSKPNAVILDFFAGSGTTLHAVNLLNAEDGGNRRCIMVTNNEIGEKAEKKMKAAGYRPGDPEWEEIGIAKYATWPRTLCSIEGHDIDGKPLKGNYLGSDAPMADGFKSNAIYFKLGFLDKNAVALGRQFKELLGVLWMKAGAIGPCPHLAKNATVPDMMILPENKMAILVNEVVYADFEAELQKHPEIETAYIITDSDRGYREMARSLNVEHTYQLYRDYLDNFRINHRR